MGSRRSQPNFRGLVFKQSTHIQLSALRDCPRTDVDVFTSYTLPRRNAELGKYPGDEPERPLPRDVVSRPPPPPSADLYSLPSKACFMCAPL